ncbi:LysR family transcriptional regulator [Streptomyces sp. KL116D]|uniref:LysR family transcriptional regulator n=1 Tax=Streptomyces sp. KL116D TaxID=3045152 RepID=UPI003557D455
MLDVRRLRILQHLAVYKTVAAAAEALQLTAPAVSQQLASLEREAGMPVVEKNGRTLRLTPAGELLVKHADVILGDLAAAEADLAALKGGRRGLIRVASFASAARTLMPLVYRLIAEHADEQARTLAVQLTVQEPDLAIAALGKRQTDVALAHSYTILPRDFPASSRHDVLMDDPVVLCLHPDHAQQLGLAPGQTADLTRFSREPWLTPAPETSCYDMIQRACGSAGFVPDIRVRSDDFAVLAALTAAGAGVALAPRLALPEHHGLSLHPLVSPVTRTLFTVIRNGTERRPDVHLLRTLMEQAASRLPGSAHSPEEA